MNKENDQIIINKGDMINCGLHEDDDYFIAKINLVGKIIKYFPGAVQVIIPQLTKEMSANPNIQVEDEVFFIHQPV
jgi:hypothetical protein